MKLDLQEVLQLMEEVESEDPIDYADLPVDEDELRRLVALSLLEHDAALLSQAKSPEECQLIYLLSAARLVLENLVLHLRLLRHEHPDVDVAALLRRLSGDGPLE